jgi:hypothetical protein
LGLLAGVCSHPSLGEEVQLMPVKLNELCTAAEVVNHVTMFFGASPYVAWYRIQHCEGILES